MLVEEGDRVRKGRLLLRLQDEEQRSALDKVKSQLAKAEREYERQKRLFAQELISEQEFNDATYELDQLRISLADAERELPWPEGSFDVVTLTGVLHHLVRPGAALAEMERVLRPGGRLIASDTCFFPPVRGFFNLCLKVHPHEGDYHFYTARQATRLLTEFGWDVVRCRRLNWWSYGAVGVRGGV